jgi:EAL domain-containing protein (putative c-di-GMP-specific phosphodiesterase class I)
MNDLQASPCYIGTRTLQLNASMGLVEVANPKQPPQEVILAAARACRLARRNGVNQIVVHEYADIAKAEHSQEFQLLREFSTGFSPRNLFLVMQPIMSLKNPFNSLDFEVLLRMRDANGKLVPTNTIIAAAEESGVAPALDKWIIQTTLEWLDKHQDQLGNTNFICLNMNGMSLNDQKFIDEFFSLLQLHRHIAHLLCIEITESVALKDLNDIHTFIEQLHSIGVRVALDDFGAGYTSFSYLKQLPADALKIDGSFIQSMTARPADVAIVEAIVALAHNLGMQSIAEWVEDCATLETLARLGVDYVQGYAVSHPKDPKEMLNARCVVDFIDDEATRAFISEHLGQEA